MQVTIPEQEAAAFGAGLRSEQYRKDERDYKVAVHIVLSALLSDENTRRDDFAELIANDRLDNGSDAPFGPDSFLEIAEIGVATAK